MSQPAKKMKISRVSADQLSELNAYRNEITKLSVNKEPLVEYLVEEDTKIFILNEIRESENRINQRLSKIEHKLNVLLERFVDDYQEEDQEAEEEVPVEEIQEDVIEYIQDENEIPAIVDESQIFPIADEETFDWFMTRLRDENYRNSLISSRWELAKTVGTRSFNVAVKDFLMLHFELAVCIKYSVSGYGSRGTKKKKLDTPSIVRFTFECFHRVYPELHPYQEVSKAVVQFWGRSQDNYSKLSERNSKREMNQKVLKCERIGD